MHVVARETCCGTVLEPPSTDVTRILGTVASRIFIVVLIERGEFHAVMVPVVSRVLSILERVAGVSTVASHFQSIFVVDLVSDLKRPVLVTDPERPVLVTDLERPVLVTALPKSTMVQPCLGMVQPWLTVVKQYGQPWLTMVYHMVESNPQNIFLVRFNHMVNHG